MNETLQAGRERKVVAMKAAQVFDIYHLIPIVENPESETKRARNSICALKLDDENSNDIDSYWATLLLMHAVFASSRAIVVRGYQKRLLSSLITTPDRSFPLHPYSELTTFSLVLHTTLTLPMYSILRHVSLH